MEQAKHRNNFILVFLLMSFTILVTSTAFISWYYRIASLYPSRATDFTAEVLVYVIHILGMLLFSFGVKRRPDLVLRRESFLICIGLWYVCSLLSMVTRAVPVVMGFGLLASVVTGLLFGYYLTALARWTKGRRGLAFGGAGAATSIASFLISLPMDGTFLLSRGVWVLYLVLALLAGGCGWLIFPGKEGAPLRDPEAQPGEAAEGASPVAEDSMKAYFLFGGLTVMLLSMVGNMGFYFPSADITQAGVDLEFSRAFYSIGLIIAGLIYDRSSKTALILCSSTILFPFVSLLLMDQVRAGAVVWVLAYIILGFVSVSRALLFVTPAGLDPKLLFLAPLGFACGRLGEALGATLGILLTPYRLPHIIVTSVVCVCTMLAFFFLLDLSLRSRIRQMTQQRPAEPREESADLSSREQEVLRMLLDGRTYKEIASSLYISENTVKFHVKNIYKKHGCANRKELIARYKR